MIQGLDQLKISARVRENLQEFVTELIQFYKHDLVSVTVFGSAAAGGYCENVSDVNLLVVYSDLNISGLDAVARIAQRWYRKRRLSPRFLSRRNLTGSARYFQIDFLEMRDSHVVLYGEDVLAGLELRRADLRWQLAHEIKRMRMRVKQQFWRACGDKTLMRAILVQRFSSLLHLVRALLVLENRPAPVSHPEIAEAAVRELGASPDFVRLMLSAKTGKARLRGDELNGAFSRLMETIRLIDERVDRLEM